MECSLHYGSTLSERQDAERKGRRHLLDNLDDLLALVLQRCAHLAYPC